jgi:predicted Zn-ribbon and HTH transcriptional regulator
MEIIVFLIFVFKKILCIIEIRGEINYMKKCPRCHHEMSEDCYLIDSAQPISDFTVIVKDENLKKKQYPIKAAVCNHCGYIELYAEMKEKES